MGSMRESRLYELLERIGNLLRGEQRAAGSPRGLLPVHLAALHYLARANRYSDTPAAVAEYLGLTKGTVSQSLQVLERAGYVGKQRDPRDGRIVRLRLTARGRRLAAETDPPELLRAAMRRLGRKAAERLEQDLQELLRQMQRAHGGRSFGVCRTCRFFERAGGGFRCGLTGEPLSLSDSALICRDHEPAPAA